MERCDTLGSFLHSFKSVILVISTPEPPLGKARISREGIRLLAPS
jgi:hypothetical protein